MKDYIKIGIDKKLIDIIDDGKKILYTHQNKKYIIKTLKNKLELLIILNL